MKKAALNEALSIKISCWNSLKCLKSF